MCFSPEADFTATAALGAIGLETLRRVRIRRELIIGALPLLFAAHQFTEGFVWLGIRGQVSTGLGDTAKEVYIVFAQAVLPAIVPVGFRLLEPDRRRARWLWPLVCVGLALSAYLLWQVTAYPIGAREEAHCINYYTHTPNDNTLAVLYVAATCGPALLSSRPYLRWFGVANLFGLVLTAALRADELTSLWCVYAALVSVLIYQHFRRQRAVEARAVAATRGAVPSH